MEMLAIICIGIVGFLGGITCSIPGTIVVGSVFGFRFWQIHRAGNRSRVYFQRLSRSISNRRWLVMILYWIFRMVRFTYWTLGAILCGLLWSMAGFVVGFIYGYMVTVQFIGQHIGEEEYDTI